MSRQYLTPIALATELVPHAFAPAALALFLFSFFKTHALARVLKKRKRRLTSAAGAKSHAVNTNI
jgi:hypothetical protein